MEKNDFFNKNKENGKLHAKLGIFGSVPITLLQDKRIKPNALRIYIALMSFEGVNESSYPSQDKIGERAGLTVQAVGPAIKNLVDTGWITARRRGCGLTNIYQCNAYFEPVEEFTDKKDGRKTNKFQNPEKILIPENFRNQDTGKLPLPDTGKLPQSYIEKTNRKDQIKRPILADTSASPENEKTTFQKIHEIFKNGSTVLPSGEYYKDGKESKHIKMLEARYEKNPERFEKTARQFFDLVKSSDKFWSEQPFTPSAFNSLYNRVIKTMDSNKAYNRDEAVSMLSDKLKNGGF